MSEIRIRRTGAADVIPSSDGRLTLSVPIQIKRRGYVSRMVNLTNLAPDFVAAILSDTMPGHVTQFELAVDPPALWQDQRKLIDKGTNASLVWSRRLRER